MDGMKVADEELQRAFVSEEELDNKLTKKSSGKKKLGIITFIVGILILAGGVVFLLVSLLKGPDIRDAEYLVQVGTWQLQGDSSVVWSFSEIGKGTLTTNFHINDYDFRWRMDGDTLKIETDWLYTLDDEYTYRLDQGDNTLTLISDDNTYTFIPASYAN